MNTSISNLDLEALDCGVSYRDADGHPGITYTTGARFTKVARQHADRITGQAVRVEGGWSYTWGDSQGVAHAQLFTDEVALETFIMCSPDKG